METNHFEKGSLFINGDYVKLEQLNWNEHPAFEGVFLKHVLKGESTGQKMSCHLVRIEPGCEIGLHNHSGKTELHEVVGGSGYCMIENQIVQYRQGIIGYIPADSDHVVKAGNDGLFILAKFFPALL